LASLRKQNPNPLFENPPSLGGEGRGVEKWDVDKNGKYQRLEGCP